MSDKPKVTGEIEIEREVDFTATLDHWTLEELEDYLEGDDSGEGREVLISESDVISEDVCYVDVPREAFTAYVEWRKSNSLFGRNAVQEASA